jgi:hypothetical protein
MGKVSHITEIACLVRLEHVYVGDAVTGCGTFFKLRQEVNVHALCMKANIHVLEVIPRRESDAYFAGTNRFNQSINNL